LNDTVPFLIPLDLILQITLPYDTQQLSKATRSTAAIYLACGVDPSKVLCNFFSERFGKSIYVGSIKITVDKWHSFCAYRLQYLYSLMFAHM